MTSIENAVVAGSLSRLNGVLYDLRGPVHERAAELERGGREILRLNIGNPAPFGFEAPEVVVNALRDALPYAHGYSESQGLRSPREAIRDHYAIRRGFPAADIDHLIGNGVSELVTLTLQALLESGDEVLIPSRTILCGRLRRCSPVELPGTTRATKTPDGPSIPPK